MNRHIPNRVKGLIIIFLVTVFSFSAHAGGGDPAELAAINAAAAGETLGQMIDRFVGSSSSVPNMISFLSFITGVFAIALGLERSKRHVELGPQNVPLSEPVKYLLAGGTMVSAPGIADMVTETAGAAGSAQEINNVGWNDTTVAGDTVDQMLVRFVENIYGPTQGGIIFFCYAFAAGFLVLSLHRMTKTAQEGARGPTGMGTIATFLTSGILFSIAPAIGTITETFYGGRSSALTEVNFLALEESLGAGSAHAENVVFSVLAFLVIVGILAIVRGIFILRGVAEGQQQATMMGGLSHLIAGGVLVNFGQFANIVQNTLGVESFGVLFS